MPEAVQFQTEDGITIAGNWYDSEGDRYALLLHMMPATKESWEAFTQRLVGLGVSCLAIDLRGHGASTNGGALDHRAFSDAEHQASARDVEAAFAYLRSIGARAEDTILVGASVGANLAMNFAVAHEIPVTVALSPGLNFYGIATSAAVRALKQGQRAILVASDDDLESAESCALLHAMNPSRTDLVVRSGIGHGTRMLEADPSLVDELLELL